MVVDDFNDDQQPSESVGLDPEDKRPPAIEPDRALPGALHDIARARGKAAVAAAGLVSEGHRDRTPASKTPEFGAVLKAMGALGPRLPVTLAPGA